MSDTFYKPTNNTTTIRHLFTANDARKVMEDLGLEIKENLRTVFSYGYWHNDALKGKKAIILRWSPFSGFLLYEPVKVDDTIFTADHKLKQGQAIVFYANDKTSEKILPINDSDWHEQLTKWFNDTKKRVFDLAVEIHNEEVEEVLNEL